MKNLYKIFLAALVAVSATVNAQDTDDLYEMSLEDLMQIEIYSVSKKKESLFDAPLSSSTITIEEIRNAGINSIPEALRLVPGVIVREMTNGNYDVHIRGLDNLTRFSDASTAGNQITLVMIDGRPVFNNNTGGIVWESLPVDLIDVERIEVVRGPSAPLYGPNAVSGVVNIITKSVEGDGLVVNGHGSSGTDNTQVAGVSLGYKVNDKFDVQVSGNMQQRDRMDSRYYSYGSGQYVDNLEATSSYQIDGASFPSAITNELFPDTELALDKKGVNIFTNYQVAEDIRFGVQAGYQNSEAQKPYRRNNYTPYSFQYFESTYANATMEYKNLRGRFSYINGEDNVNSVPTFLPNGNQLTLEYTYENIDTYLEYDYHVNDALSIRPGISYQRSTYTGKDQGDAAVGALNGEQTIRTFSASLRADYHITDAWRVVGAGRLDRFTAPEENFISYQLATTYDINEKNIIRAVYAKSNSGSFQAQTFLNISETYDVPTPFGTFPGIFEFQGNEELDLFEVQLIELGYRSKLQDNLELNLEVFYQVTDNSNDIVNDEVPAPYLPQVSQVAQFQNLPLRAKQFGATFSFNYVPSVKLQVKPYITIQKTETEDFPVALNTPGYDASANIEITTEADNDQTPSVFGGFYLNYKPASKWNVNINSYYLGEQTQYSFYDVVNTTNTAGEIDGKFILNAKVNYSINDNFGVFVNGRNLLDNDNVEYYAADRNGMLLMGGLDIRF